MFWLMWITMMLAVPVLAGVQVWWQMRQEVREVASAPSLDEQLKS